MKALRRLLTRMGRSFLRRGSDAEMAEELESHIQMQTDDNLRAGMTHREARRMAVLKFGSVESAKENYRDQRGLPGVETTIQDLRYALRGIRRNPGFATVAILSLAIGIGANTAVFSLVNGVLLQPLTYKDPQRVFAVREVNPQVAGRMPMRAPRRSARYPGSRPPAPSPHCPRAAKPGTTRSISKGRLVPRNDSRSTTAMPALDISAR